MSAEPRDIDAYLIDSANRNARWLSGEDANGVFDALAEADVIMAVWVDNGELQRHCIKGAAQLQRIVAEGRSDHLSVTAVHVEDPDDAQALEEHYFEWLQRHH